jgi:hypothetical protein
MPHTRDEKLFWRMIDTYGTPDPCGIATHNEIKGIDYIKNDNLVIPALEVRCLVNNIGVSVWLCTNYQGFGIGKAQELSAQIPECTEIAAKFYFWEDFKFDSFINWTISLKEWEDVLQLYVLKFQ